MSEFAFAGTVDGRAVFSRTADNPMDVDSMAEMLALAILRKYGGPEGLRAHALALREQNEGKARRDRPCWAGRIRR